MEKYFLIGGKLTHSYSPEIHGYFKTSYGLKELKENELDSFFEKRDFSGINVTIPYKKAVMKYLDFADDAAKKVCAVNTIVNRDGKLYGYNTDIRGLEYQIRSLGLTLADKKVVITGSGGTSCTAKYLCEREGAKETVIVSRTGENNYKNLEKNFDADILINATPVGTYPNTEVSPVDLFNFTKLSGVVDVIYNPLKTKLLYDAEVMGIPCCNGLKMLIAQAKYANGLFTGKELEDGIIEEIYRELSAKIQNVVLIGMPLSGKSTIGRLLAKKLNKIFIDTDGEIEKKEGMSIPEIFERKGEAYFRRVEAEIIEKFTKERGLVIATGGGAVLNGDFYPRAKQNGVIVGLSRPFEPEKAEGRPLIKLKEDYFRLLKSRFMIYRTFADISVENDGEAEETVNKIMEAL